jgi:hypothetical protein
MDNHEEILNAAIGHMERRVALALELLAKLRFSKTLGQHFAVTCLHTRTIHLAAGCAAAAKVRATPCIPIIVRSMWEAAVDTDNLIAQPDYAQDMYASFLEQKLRFSTAAAPEKENPLLVTVPDAVDLVMTVAQTRAELEALKRRGHSAADVKERARRVNRLHEYDAVYGPLCLDAHNNVRSLETDHVQQHADGDFSLSFYGDRMTPGATVDVLLGVGLLLQSIVKTHVLLGTTDARLPTLFDDWLRDRGEIEAAYQGVEDKGIANKQVHPIAGKPGSG